MSTKSVVITISNQKTTDIYLAKSYPSRDFDHNGMYELYKTPIYEVFIDRFDQDGTTTRKAWTAIRFAPYYNDPKQPDARYRHRGWANAGLHHLAKKPVTSYDPYYKTHNAYSAHSGAIQMRNSFLIHAGPETLGNSGWASAGCVEIIGSFSQFKGDIAALSGISASTVDATLLALVKVRKLFVQVEYAVPPDFRSQVDSEHPIAFY
jgi:hypothetical protein